MQALGLLATLLLRQPEHCSSAFAQPNLVRLVVDAMNAHEASASVMRQACQVVRNLVVRNPDLRKPVMNTGAHIAMRSARNIPECSDVARAALRDLGFDDYAT